MRTLLRLVARLYPAKWRARYGPELDGLLDDMTPIWQDVLDVAKGGLQMQLRHSVVSLAVLFSIVGAGVAMLVTLTLPTQFIARGFVSMQPRDTAADPLSTLRTTTFSGDQLRSVLDAHNLFPSDGGHREKRLRDSIRLDPVTKNALRVSFTYPDARTAQQVTWELEVLLANTVRANTLLTNTALSRVIYEYPNTPPTAEGPHLLAFVATGLLGGAMLGMMIGILWQQTRPST
jgi:hypothetical protein